MSLRQEEDVPEEHRLEIIIDENESTPNRKRLTKGGAPIPNKIRKSSPRGLFGSLFAPIRYLMGFDPVDNEEEEVVALQSPSTSNRSILQTPPSFHHNHNGSRHDSSIVFEGVAPVPDVIATTAKRKVCVPKEWPTDKSFEVQEDEDEEKGAPDDEVQIVGEVAISPNSDLSRERRSVEEIMGAVVTGVVPEVVTVEDSGSDSISILSETGVQNGDNCLSPGPDDSVSRQNTPRSFYEEFRTPRDSWSRKRPGKLTKQSEHRTIPRVGTSTPTHSRLDRIKNRRSNGSVYFTPTKDMVGEAGGHLIYAQTLREMSQRTAAGAGYTPKKVFPSRIQKKLAPVNCKEYLERARIAIRKCSSASIQPVITLDEDSASSSTSCSSVQTVSSDEVEVLSTASGSISSYHSSARSQVDDLLANISTNKMKTKSVVSEFQSYRAEKRVYDRHAQELLGQDKELSKNRDTNYCATEDELRERLAILGIKTPKPKPKEKDEFPELPKEALAIVERAWVRANPGEVFCEGFDTKITRKDLTTLSGLSWLNDEVINFYLQLICLRSKEDDKLPKVYAFNTFFYPNIATKGYASVKRWTRKVDIFSYDILLVPVHVNKIHWCMATVDLAKKRIDYFDSMHGTNNKCLADLQKYLMEESKDKRKREFDTSGWTLANRSDCPQQENGSDCGVFSCRFAEYASRRRELNFGQEHMQYYRKRMVYEIVTKKLM